MTSCRLPPYKADYVISVYLFMYLLLLFLLFLIRFCYSMKDMINSEKRGKKKSDELHYITTLTYFSLILIHIISLFYDTITKSFSKKFWITWEYLRARMASGDVILVLLTIHNILNHTTPPENEFQISYSIIK